MVRNGNELDCLHLCNNVSIHVQGHVFIVDFHVMPLTGADLVLGVQWLKSLGLILKNYSDLTMQFFHTGRVIQLQGNRDGDLDSFNTKQLQQMVTTNSTSAFFHI